MATDELLDLTLCGVTGALGAWGLTKLCSSTPAPSTQQTVPSQSDHRYIKGENISMSYDPRTGAYYDGDGYECDCYGIRIERNRSRRVCVNRYGELVNRYGELVDPLGNPICDGEYPYTEDDLYQHEKRYGIRVGDRRFEVYGPSSREERPDRRPRKRCPVGYRVVRVLGPDGPVDVFKKV